MAGCCSPCPCYVVPAEVKELVTSPEQQVILYCSQGGVLESNENYKRGWQTRWVGRGDSLELCCCCCCCCKYHCQQAHLLLPGRQQWHVEKFSAPCGSLVQLAKGKGKHKVTNKLSGCTRQRCLILASPSVLGNKCLNWQLSKRLQSTSVPF